MQRQVYAALQNFTTVATVPFQLEYLDMHGVVFNRIFKHCASEFQRSIFSCFRFSGLECGLVFFGYYVIGS